MHILFLTDNFPPEVNAPASRTYEHSREWVKSGEEVTIITCAPNFPKGKIFPGYKNNFWQTEVIDGIKVIRVWTYITANEGFFKRILDYVSFMVSAVIASFFVKKVDIVIGTSPQFFTVCAAYLVGLFKRKPWVFELRDLWPETINTVSAIKSRKLLFFLERIELFLYRKSSMIISLTKNFKKDLIERNIDPKKIEIVTNGVDIEKFVKQPKPEKLIRSHKLKNIFRVGYIGTIGMCHGLEIILNSANEIRNKYNNKDIVFLVVGDGSNKQDLKIRATEMQIENIIFVDSVNKKEVVDYLSLLDLSLIHLINRAEFEKVIPSKLFESMSMGIPIVHGVRGESADIVKDSGCGIVFKPGNSEDLTKKIIYLKENPEEIKKLQKNCLEIAKNYNRKNLSQKMLGYISTLLEK